MVAVFDLSLQQDFPFEQQDFPFPDLLFFPLSAKVTPVTKKAAIANKNTFFMMMGFIVINQGKNRSEKVKCQF